MLLQLVGVASFAYCALVCGLYLVQRQLLYHPDQTRPTLGELAGLGVREASVNTADGLALLAWYLPPARDRPIIAYFHGNGGHIGYRAERLKRFASEGFGVLMAEYRGYGGNPGGPGEAGLVADGLAALDFLRRERVPGERIVLWGESLGSGVVVQLAAQRQAAALVLEAPFTSVAEVAQSHYPFLPAARLVRDRFDSMAFIGRVSAPVLVLHGGRDSVVPVRYGRALFEAARQPKEFWFAAEARHENLVHFGALDAAVGFIERRFHREGVAVSGRFD